MTNFEQVPDVNDANHGRDYEILDLINPEPNSQDSVRSDEMQDLDLVNDVDVDSEVDDDAVKIDNDEMRWRTMRLLLRMTMKMSWRMYEYVSEAPVFPAGFSFLRFSTWQITVSKGVSVDSDGKVRFRFGFDDAVKTLLEHLTHGVWFKCMCNNLDISRSRTVLVLTCDSLSVCFSVAT